MYLLIFVNKNNSKFHMVSKLTLGSRCTTSSTKAKPNHKGTREPPSYLPPY